MPEFPLNRSACACIIQNPTRYLESRHPAGPPLRYENPYWPMGIRSQLWKTVHKIPNSVQENMSSHSYDLWEIALCKLIDGLWNLEEPMGNGRYEKWKFCVRFPIGLVRNSIASMRNRIQSGHSGTAIHALDSALWISMESLLNDGIYKGEMPSSIRCLQRNE